LVSCFNADRAVTEEFFEMPDPDKILQETEVKGSELMFENLGMPSERWIRMMNTPGLLQSSPLLHVEGARLHLLHAIIPDGYCLSYRLTDQFALEGGGGEGGLVRLGYTYCGYSAPKSVSFLSQINTSKVR
jgi:hypothetical protein